MTPAPPDRRRRAVEAAVAFVRAAQLPSREIPSYATPLEGDRCWVADTGLFVTSLAVGELAWLPAPDAGEIVRRGRNFILAERQPGPLWRYWARANDRWNFIPCDADDTSCASLAVAGSEFDTSPNRALLLANRDRRGRFFTWFVPRRPVVKRYQYWRSVWREIPARRRRKDFWRDTEATPADVDVTVNAHVCRYLGSDAPVSATKFVAEVVTARSERDHDSWYRTPWACARAVADGAMRGVPDFAELGAVVASRISHQLEEHGSIGTALDTAFALLALDDFGLSPELTGTLADHLLATQAEDGSWERSVFYYGGPKEVFGWGSEAYTAAVAAVALSRIVTKV